MRLCYHPEKERRKKDEMNYFSGIMLSKLVIKKTKAFQAREQNKRENRKRNAENKVNNQKISSVA